jgi:hypothetical protein
MSAGGRTAKERTGALVGLHDEARYGLPMTDVTLPLTGGCGCGAVRYEITAPLVAAGYCHCTRCQRRTGTAASAQARVAPGSFQLVSGADAVRTWSPEGGFEKAFCGVCGSGLFSRDPHDPSVISVRLGSVDGDPGIRPQVRTFVAYAVPWEPIPDDGLPRFPEQRPG